MIHYFVHGFQPLDRSLPRFISCLTVFHTMIRIFRDAVRKSGKYDDQKTPSRKRTWYEACKTHLSTSYSRHKLMTFKASRYKGQAQRTLDAPGVEYMIGDTILAVNTMTNTLVVRLGQSVCALVNHGTPDERAYEVCDFTNCSEPMSSVEIMNQPVDVVMCSIGTTVQVYGFRDNKFIRLRQMGLKNPDDEDNYLVHQYDINCICCRPVSATPGRGHIITGDRNGRVIEHNLSVKDHAMIQYEYDNYAVTSMDSNHSGTSFAVGYENGSICIFNYGCGIPKTILPNAHGIYSVISVRFCPFDSSVLLSGGSRFDNTLALWNANSGKLRRRTDTQSSISSIQWSPIVRNEILVATMYPMPGTPNTTMKIYQYGTMNHTLRNISSTVNKDSKGEECAGMAIASTGTVWTIGMGEIIQEWDILTSFRAPTRKRKRSAFSINILDQTIR